MATDLRPTCPVAYRQLTVDCVLESCLTAMHQQFQAASGETLPQFDSEFTRRKVLLLNPLAQLPPANLTFQSALIYGLCPVNTPPGKQDDVALGYRITSWQRLPQNYLVLAPWTSTIDTTLDSGQPVIIEVIGANVGDPHWTLTNLSGYGHSICLVANPADTYYWFLNTWGTSWGLNGGYGQVDRAVMIPYHSGASGIYTCKVADTWEVPGTPQVITPPVVIIPQTPTKNMTIKQQMCTEITALPDTPTEAQRDTLLDTLVGLASQFDLAPPDTGATNAVSFIGQNTTIKGTWKTNYGVQGYNVIGDSVSYPNYVTVTPAGNSSFTYTANTADTRALQRSATGRIVSVWYAPAAASFTVDLNFGDSSNHKVSFYCLDWDSNRSIKVEILDGDTDIVLDTRTLTSYSGGVYLSYSCSGHLIAKFTGLSNRSPLLNGIFFDAAP